MSSKAWHSSSYSITSGCAASKKAWAIRDESLELVPHRLKACEVRFGEIELFEGVVDLHRRS